MACGGYHYSADDISSGRAHNDGDLTSCTYYLSISHSPWITNVPHITIGARRLMVLPCTDEALRRVRADARLMAEPIAVEASDGWAELRDVPDLSAFMAPRRWPRIKVR